MKNLKDVYVGVNKSDANRNTNDLYRTPPLATYVLCKYSDVPLKLVEPCAGYGNISLELERNGHEVLSYDMYPYKEQLVNIKTPYDVMEMEKIEGIDGLVTNPPYHKDLPRKIAEKSIRDYNYTALFLRLTFLEGKKRKELFDKNPPSEIIFMSDRINFGCEHVEAIEKTDQIGGMIAYMWIIWDKEKTHQNTKLKWVNLSEEYDEWRTRHDMLINTAIQMKT